MRLSFPTNRLVGAAVFTTAAVSLLTGGAGPAAATVPGTNGTIVTSKCDDGAATCKVDHVWKVDPPTGSEVPLTSDPAWFDSDPAISPDGQQVAFQRCTDSSQTQCVIALVGIGGGTPVNLTAGANDNFPAFSPDGSKIAFSRADGTGNERLIVMDANGANQQPLTSGSVEDRAPAWSPDGSTIAFQRFTAVQTDRIYAVPASGGTPVILETGDIGYAPSFSPDGSHIAFSNGARIEMMDSNGANPHAVTPIDANNLDYGPVFSPDGTQIAYTRYAAADPNPTPLMVMNVDGSNAHPITPVAEAFYRPDWQSTHPAPAPGGPAQAAGPRLKLSAPKKESVRKGRIYLFATSSEAAAGTAGGKVVVPKLAKSYRLRSASNRLSANTRTKVSLKIPRKTLRAVRHALAHRQSVTATLAVRVKDSAGNSTSKKLKVRLTK
jgi:dipeptidyl aminopeptidase/acylaminoacyl peptidase